MGYEICCGKDKETYEVKKVIVILSVAKNLTTLHAPLGRFFAALKKIVLRYAQNDNGE